MKNAIAVLVLLYLSSCTDTSLPFEEKKLFEKEYRLGDVVVTQYAISLITSIHDHLDVTKDGKTVERILKVNTDEIDTVYLVKDTIVVKTRPHRIRPTNYILCSCLKCRG